MSSMGSVSALAKSDFDEENTNDVSMDESCEHGPSKETPAQDSKQEESDDTPTVDEDEGEDEKEALEDSEVSHYPQTREDRTFPPEQQRTFTSGLVMWVGGNFSSHRADKAMQMMRRKGLEVVTRSLDDIHSAVKQRQFGAREENTPIEAIVLDTSAVLRMDRLACIHSDIRENPDLQFVTVVVWDEDRRIDLHTARDCRVLQPDSRPMDVELMELIATPVRKIEINLKEQQMRNPDWNGIRCVLITTGSLNPVHRGHVEMMEHAMRQLNAKENMCVLGGFMSPSHDSYIDGKFGNSRNAIPAKYRIRCIQDAIVNSPYLSCDCWEAFQDGFVDFPEVARRLQVFLMKMFPRDDLRVFYVCGMDHANKCGLVGGSLSWNGVGTLIVQRPGYHGHAHDNRAKSVFFVPSPQNSDRSSTKVRDLLRKYDRLQQDLARTRTQISEMIHESTFDLIMSDSFQVFEEYLQVSAGHFGNGRGNRF